MKAAPVESGPRDAPPPIGGDFYNCWTGDPHFTCRSLAAGFSIYGWSACSLHRDHIHRYTQRDRERQSERERGDKKKEREREKEILSAQRGNLRSSIRSLFSSNYMEFSELKYPRPCSCSRHFEVPISGECYLRSAHKEMPCNLDAWNQAGQS